MRRRGRKDSEDHMAHGPIARIIEYIIIFVVLGFAVKFCVEAILSVKISLIIISVICIAIVIGYRIYRYKRDHDDY